MKIGLLGGTFDPFHRGHLEPVLAVQRLMEWDQILFVPAWQQPFKADSAHASPFHRYAMAILATEGNETLFVSDLELRRESVSYTVETLEALRAHDSESVFDWIIGDDNLARLMEWRSIDRLLELANFTVLDRNADGERGERVPAELRDRVMDPAARERAGAICFASNEAIAVSSTDIRSSVRAGGAIEGFVDPRVSRYIQHYNLYKEA